MGNFTNLKVLFKSLLILGISCFIFSSCSPEYIPNMVNSPMFSNAGEFQASIATGNSSFDAQTAVAITDHIGIMLNGSYGNETSDSSDDFHKHTFIEVGAGYFEKIGEKGRCEIYGGYGFGEVEGYFESALFDDEITDARYNRFFIQPGIGLSTGIFDGSFSPRIVLVQMDPRGSNFGAAEYNAFFEPVIISKIGYKYVKFIAQFGLSIPVGDSQPTYEHQHFIFNVGLNFNIGRKYYDF
jgi:hypothetical protein